MGPLFDPFIALLIAVPKALVWVLSSPLRLLTVAIAMITAITLAAQLLK